jgi:hypothetical protein
LGLSDPEENSAAREPTVIGRLCKKPSFRETVAPANVTYEAATTDGLAEQLAPAATIDPRSKPSSLLVRHMRASNRPLSEFPFAHAATSGGTRTAAIDPRLANC